MQDGGYGYFEGEGRKDTCRSPHSRNPSPFASHRLEVFRTAWLLRQVWDQFSQESIPCDLRCSSLLLFGYPGSHHSAVSQESLRSSNSRT